MNQTFETPFCKYPAYPYALRSKKFVQELERGATRAELEAIQARMKDIADALANKEQEESKLKTKK
jgi:hypothetical protein